jgi:hypothetical protein
MKKIITISRWSAMALLGMLLFSVLFTSCEEDDKAGPITISKVYLEDVNSTVKDREVTFARLGQLLRIEGSGFLGMKKVYINGLAAYFNPVFVSDNSMLVNIPSNTPTVDAAAAVRNTIRLVNDGYEVTYTFTIMESAPTITSISHTMPLVGETITLYGSGLKEVTKLTFPGNVVVTDGIISDKDGKFCTVKMPDGVSEDGGSILIECANGGAYSPAYFNFKKGVLLNFDGKGTQGYWGSTTSMIKDVDLESTVIGTGNVSQGNYCAHRPSRIASFDAAKTRCSEVWTAGNDVDDWRGQLTPFIPATTALGKVALQFDIYVPEAWKNSGFLKISMVNGFNGGEWSGNCYNFVPWVVDGKIVPYQTTGWTTVTIPLTKIYALATGEKTFEDALVLRESADWQNFGFFFENSDFTLKNITGLDSDNETSFASAATSVKVYTDNWRIVSLATPVYSDFPTK